MNGLVYRFSIPINWAIYKCLKPKSVETAHCGMKKVNTCLVSLAWPLTLPMLRLLSSKTQGHKYCWKLFKPCHVVIHWVYLLRSTLSWSPMCQGFNHFSVFLYHFVRAKLATSSMRANYQLYWPNSLSSQLNSWLVGDLIPYGLDSTFEQIERRINLGLEAYCRTLRVGLGIWCLINIRMALLG